MHLTDGHFSPYFLFAFLVSGHWGITSPHCHSRRASVLCGVEITATFFRSLCMKLHGCRCLSRGDMWWPFPPDCLLLLSESPRRAPFGRAASTCFNIRSSHRPHPSWESQFILPAHPPLWPQSSPFISILFGSSYQTSASHKPIFFQSIFWQTLCPKVQLDVLI